jgi:hypothetical protein
LSYFGATARSIPGVLTPKQFDGVTREAFTKANSPKNLGKPECDFLKRAIAASEGVMSGDIGDPFESQGGVYGFRTTGHGGPGGNSFYPFPSGLQISGSGNTFYGLGAP